MLGALAAAARGAGLAGVWVRLLHVDTRARGHGGGAALRCALRARARAQNAAPRRAHAQGAGPAARGALARGAHRLYSSGGEAEGDDQGERGEEEVLYDAVFDPAFKNTGARRGRGRAALGRTARPQRAATASSGVKQRGATPSPTPPHRARPQSRSRATWGLT